VAGNVRVQGDAAALKLSRSSNGRTPSIESLELHRVNYGKGLGIGMDHDAGSSGTLSFVGAAGSPGKVSVAGKLLHSPPAVRVNHSAALVSIPNWEADTVLPFNTERWDNDNTHDTTTNNSRLTAKTAGLYLIVANVTWDESPTSGVKHTRIVLDGSTPHRPQLLEQYSTSKYHTGQIATTTYRLAVNEYVEVMVQQNSGAPAGDSAHIAGSRPRVQAGCPPIRARG
jgi:hypothetical protein